MNVPRLPYLAPWYRVAHAPGALLLEYGQRIVSFEGGAAERMLPALLPLLDGMHTVDEVVCVLGEPIRPAVEQALGELAARGLLVEGPPPDDLAKPVVEAASLLTALLPGATRVTTTVEAIAGLKIAIAGEGTAGVEAGRLLRIAGAGVDRVGSVETGADLTVCAPAPDELPRLTEWNREALEAKATWLALLPFDGRYATVGPLFLPGETACYECFRCRRVANLDGCAELSVVERAPAAYPSSPAVDALLGGLAAQVVLAHLILDDHYSPAAFYAVGLVPAIGVTLHHVYRVPRCTACSGLDDTAAPLPWHKEMPLAVG